MIHADHGGGNNSTFTTRVLTSSGTDTYSAVSAAIGSLKGPRHGGANIKVMEMADDMLKNISNIRSDAEVRDYLAKMLKKQAGDRSGLVYGMGHAVYTLSDPRAVEIKGIADNLHLEGALAERLELLEAVERLTPEVVAEVKGTDKPMCANVDLYSGVVYSALGIPPELFTPIFAVSRIAGWSAHRVEELTSGSRIIRPAYKAVVQKQPYVSMDKR